MSHRGLRRDRLADQGDEMVVVVVVVVVKKPITEEGVADEEQRLYKWVSVGLFEKVQQLPHGHD